MKNHEEICFLDDSDGVTLKNRQQVFGIDKVKRK
jgi:hypothetical protein